MIIITRRGVTDAEIDHIRERIESAGLRTHLSRGVERTIIGCVGDEAALRGLPLLSIPGVEAVHEVLKPYKLASREFSTESTTIPFGGTVIGSTEFVVVAGPCSVEGPEMMSRTAEAVASAGARGIRGGAFKPRSSPYAFRGLGEEGLKILSEIRSVKNFNLLTEVGRTHRPVLLKRGLSATVKELLLAAEYVMSQGNPHVILCERGIRTFETTTRNTFDLAAIPVLKRETHLPVFADPSHAAGRRPLVAPLAYAAVAAGADGLLVEVHPDPETAASDGEQSLDLPEFGDLMRGLAAFCGAAGRTLAAGASQD
jgi:3-deoxy-7-phosphoheptulonate synthase